MCYSIKGTVTVEVEKSEKISILLKPESAYIAPHNKEYALAYEIDSKEQENDSKEQKIAMRKKCELNFKAIKIDSIANCFLSVLLSAAETQRTVEVFVKKDWEVTKVRFPAS